MAADSPEVEEAGLAVGGDGYDVVLFEASGPVTACDDARGVAVSDGSLEFCGDVAAVVTDRTDIYPFCDQDFQERTAEEIFACLIDRDRPDARYLASFTLA